jgi:signal transduction histidine kinase
MGVGVGEGRMGRFLVICMALGFAALLLAGGAAVWSTVENETHTGWVNHTYAVELAIDEASILIEQGETTRRGYLLTRRPTFLKTYRTIGAQLSPALQRIATLTSDNPIQQRNIAQWRALIAAVVVQRDQTMALVAAGDAAGAVRAFDAETSAKRMRRIRDLAQAMVGEERRLLALRDEAQRESVRLFYWSLGIAGVLLVLVAAVSLMTVLRYTRDLAGSRDRLRDFADTLEEQVRERTSDVTRANEEIQRFAYIVSHDLRSPLVNVMGFTAELEGATTLLGELVDRVEETAPDILTEEARLAAREDLPEAIGFIRTSTQKMDRLINAILKLSREGRRMIAPEKLDLTQMIAQIEASLTQQIEHRGATLTVEGALPTIVSDRLAIEQIFSNLIENAVKYLSDDRPGRIVVRGRQHGQRVTYEIEDNGRGIAASDHQRVFDLFRRAGNQDQPGEGIGLAHVRALAYRLGGVIDVASELGQGTTFILTLPVTYTDPSPAVSRET